MIVNRNLIQKLKENPSLVKEIFYMARHSGMDREEARQLILGMPWIVHLNYCSDSFIFSQAKNPFSDQSYRLILKYIKRKRWGLAR